MTSNASRTRTWLAWTAYALGLLCPAPVFFIANHASHPASDWDTSFFGKHLAIPIMGIGFLSCAASPFFTQHSRRRKILALALGIVGFGLVLVTSLLISIMKFGIGIGG